MRAIFFGLLVTGLGCSPPSSSSSSSSSGGGAGATSTSGGAVSSSGQPSSRASSSGANSSGGSVSSASVAENAPGTGPAFCSSGWCWSAPAPNGDDFSSIWGTADNNVYLVGRNETRAMLTRWTGDTWLHVLDAVTLGDIWGSSANDVFVVGSDANGGVIFHLTGDSYGAFSIGADVRLLAVDGTAPNDVWVCGDHGIVMHWDGVDWVYLPAAQRTDACTSILALSPTDAWIGMAGHSLCHHDGVDLTCDVTISVNTIASLGDDILVSGDNGVVVSQDAGWRHGHQCGVVSDVMAFPPSIVTYVDGYGVCERNNGVWSSRHFASMPVFSAGWGADPSHLWLAGSGGTLWRTQGDGGVPMNQTDTLTVVAPLSAQDIWVGGWRETVMHFNGRTWRRVNAVPASAYTGNVTGIHAVSADDIWFAAGARLLHWDGAELRVVSPASTDASVFLRANAVWGAASNDVWIAAEASGNLLHWDGQHFASVHSEMIMALDGLSASDVYGLSMTNLLHYNGMDWSAVPLPAQELSALLVVAPDVVYVGGLTGLYRYDGVTFTRLSTRSVAHLGWDGTQLWWEQALGLPLPALTDAGVPVQLTAVLMGGFAFAPDGTAVAVGEHGTILVRQP